MSVEVDACSEVSQVLEKSGLAYEDFGKGGACVGIGIPLSIGIEIESDGAFDSFVMINGNDEVADDSVLVDPDREAELECSGNGSIEIDAVDGEDSVLDQSGDKEEEAEQNLLTVPNISLSNDLALSSLNTLEGNRRLENSTMASSIVLVGSVEINCKQAFPSLPLNNATIKSFHFSLAAENLRLDIKDKSCPESIDCCLQGTKIEAKSESGIVDKESRSSCLSNDEGSTNSVSELNEVEIVGSTCEEVKVFDDVNLDLSFGTHSSSHNTAETQNVVAEVGSGELYFVRIPRYEDEIKLAQSLVDENTRIQDSFSYQIQTTKAACEESGGAAKSEARAARESLKLKRKEIETVQSMINKAKESIDEIGIRINNMTHETLPLKEEKQLSRDIKKSALLGDQLSLDDASKQGELQLALDQKGEVEERLKPLRKEMEQPVLNNDIKKEAAAENLVSPGLTMEQNKPIELVETVKDDHELAKEVKKKKKRTKTKNPVDAVATLPDDQESVSVGVEVSDTKYSIGLDFADARETHKRSKEEEELEKRAEELMKEEEAIWLQEQLKLDEKAKAEIALARKKRKAERAQARAALRAQKEAEEKEKEKEKKSRKKKKKKKKPAAEDAKNKADIEEEPQPAVSTETPTDIPQAAEESKTTSTKSQNRPPSSTKQKKAKPIIPPQLRKGGKRKMEMWVWILVSVIIVLVLFLLFLGNGDYLMKLGM